jgi:3-oxoadipate enol-lactonase
VNSLAVDGLYTEVDGEGPSVVLTHDGLLDSASFDAQFDELARDYRVARWDRRGYGRSPRPTEPYSSVEDLAAVVQAMPGSRAALVGSSFGGFVTVQCALDHPELVRALVLVGPIVTGLALSEHFTTRGGHGMPGPDARDAEQIGYWAETDPWFTAPTSVAARERLRSLLTASPQNLHAASDLDSSQEKVALPRLGEIAVPTLLVVGEHDIADVHAHCGAMEAAIPGATRIVLSGSGHLPQLEVPAEFNRLILAFLAGSASN